MIPGRNKYLTIFLFILFYFNFSLADEKITSVPLINLENLKPSYEEVERESNEKEIENSSIKEKKQNPKFSKDNSIKILGLDKITAKTKEINIKLEKLNGLDCLKLKQLNVVR